MAAGAPATFGQRFIALIIDAVILMALGLPGFILLILGSAIGGGFGVLVLLIGILLMVASVFASLYIYFAGIGNEGQTPGKRMQGVKVVNASGGTIGVGGAVIRYIVQYLTNIICYIGSLWMLFDAEKKTLYDKILDNQVIQVEKGELMPLFPGGKPF
jgi:uncharacterized RDD family membrane protein YckC